MYLILPRWNTIGRMYHLTVHVRIRARYGVCPDLSTRFWPENIDDEPFNGSHRLCIRIYNRMIGYMTGIRMHAPMQYHDSHACKHVVVPLNDTSSGRIYSGQRSLSEWRHVCILFITPTRSFYYLLFIQYTNQLSPI
jgi:hypothetical protein